MGEKEIETRDGGDDVTLDGASLNDTPPPQPPAAKIEGPPNGGLKAWLQVLGSFFLFFNSWGIVNTFGVYQTYYSMHLNETPSNISWIGSIQAFLLLVVGAISGPLFDAGYFRHLVLFGSFMAVFGMMMTSLCTQYYQLILAQAICVGIGCGCLFVPSVAILPMYFSTRKALATGIAAAGSSLGGVLFPIIFSHLLPRIGFGWATRVIAFIMFATLLLSISLMRVRVQPAQKRKLFQFSALKEPPFALFNLGMFFGFTGLYIPFFYTQSYAVAEGLMSESLAQYLFSILNAASIFGRIIPNFAADKIGPFNVLIPATVAASILAFCWVAIKDSAGIIVFVALYGFVSGGFVSLPPTVLFTITPDPKYLGTRMGMNFALSGLGVLMGTPVAGTLVRQYGYGSAIAFCGANVTCAWLLFVAARTAKVGPKLAVVA